MGWKTILSKHPRPRKVNANPSQVENKIKFLLACLYAKDIFNYTDQSLAEAYANALKPRQNVLPARRSISLHAQSVISIGTRTYKGMAGDKITIREEDDFRVTSLQVEVFHRMAPCCKKVMLY